MKQDYCYIPVKVTVFNNEEKSEVITWLRHNIDGRDYDYEHTAYLDDYEHTDYLILRNYITVYFARSKDAVLFALKWS